jgi:uncharacterized protein
MYIKRIIQNSITKSLFKGKVIIIYGARQVGKTTLVKEIMADSDKESLYLNCDEPDVRAALTNKSSTELKSFIGNTPLIVIDEAQRVLNIGLTLKLLIDNFPDSQIIAAGSSSFELSNKIKEPLTGRKLEFCLYPLSIKELTQLYNEIEINRLLAERMVFGMYPGVIFAPDNKEQILRELATSYSYKDVLAFQDMRKPEILERLLQALALQIGNEVSYLELAQLLGVSKETVENYIDILEKAYIIFKVGPFSRNLRNELKRKRKIYFYDLGLRNALINNLNPLELRQDVGALWENFLVLERMKHNNNLANFANVYFWRTMAGQELDYIEDIAGQLFAYEFKWSKNKFNAPKDFLKAYPGSTIKLINRDNYFDFLVK